MVLVDAGVRRARLGDIEVEWPAPAPVVYAEPPEDHEVPAPATRPQPAPSTGQHPGYEQLFGGKFPAFKKATEPQG